MYAVVQFIENNKFQVLAVPVSWIRSGNLLWPKMSNDKIEHLRVSGNEFHGAHKRIPVIVTGKFRSFEAAEKAADELAKKEVSDVEGKKKKLKPQKKPPLATAKDYNAMVAALQNHPKESRPPPTAIPPSTSELACVLSEGPSGIRKQTSSLGNVMQQKPNKAGASKQAHVVPKACTPPVTVPISTTNPSSLASEFATKPQIVHQQFPQTQCIEQPSSQYQTSSNAQPIPSASKAQARLSIPHGALEHRPMVTQPQYAGSAGEVANGMVFDATATREMQQQPERFYCTAEDIIFLPDTVYDQANLEDHVITDSTGTVKYQDLKKDLQSFIEVTVENAVKKHVGEHFSRLAALTVMNAKAPTQTVPEKADDPVENHQRIDNEPELHEWNVKLASEDLRAKYLIYFTRVIPPNSYVSNGDNACYTIVDCLFTREFWTRFTWTGISRGQKSKRGFREFGNVLQLLVDLVCIGDPSYSAHKLEDFCRTRLFRYSMSRSTNKRLRKSACRPERKLKKMHEQSIDNPAELVDVVQSDSAEEPGNDQDEMMDVKTNEADSENDNYADDEDVFNASDNEALDESDSDD